MIAQDVLKVLPEVVSGDENKESLVLVYTEIVPVLIKATKEQQTMIEELKKRVEELENQ